MGAGPPPRGFSALGLAVGFPAPEDAGDPRPADFQDFIAFQHFHEAVDFFGGAGAFDALNRLFSRDSRLLRSAREVGLQMLDRLPALKRLAIAEAAGLNGELPRLLRGELA